MYTPFDTLSNDARIWIYPASRPFTDEELPEISKKTEEFLTQWTAHGAMLKAGFTIPYNRFIVFGLDESEHAATGCSIDGSVRFIQSLEQEYNLVLLDKMNVSFKQGVYITHKSLLDFKTLVKKKSVTENTIVFNNLVTNKSEF